MKVAICEVARFHIIEVHIDPIGNLRNDILEIGAVHILYVS